MRSAHTHLIRLVGVILALSMTTLSGTAYAEFVGELVLVPNGCENEGLCKLGEDFGFVDDSGLGWEAAKDLLTDGASIPPWAQPFVGGPFDHAFIKAAVLHDHYCDRHVRSWRKTHRMFHEALLASDVEPVKAGIMYFAVLVGGPKWVRLIKGKPCPVGTGCINQFNISASLPSNSIGLNSDGKLIMMRPASYGSASFSNMMEKYVPELEALGPDISAENAEAIAAKAIGDDFYFRNEDEIGTGLSVNFDTQQ